MSKRYEEMSIEELKAEIKELEFELEDIEDDRAMVLGQQGQHISSKAYNKRFDLLMEDANEKIQNLKELINQR